MMVDEKVFIGHVRVDAGGGIQGSRAEVWQKGLNEIVEIVGFLGSNLTVCGVRIDRFALVVPCHFYAGTEIWKPIKKSPGGILTHINRAVIGSEAFGRIVTEPDEELSLEGNRQLRNEFFHPTASANDEVTGCVSGLRCF